MDQLYPDRFLSGEMSAANPEADECLGEMLSDVEANDIREKIPLNSLATSELIAKLKGDEPMDCIFRVLYRENNRGWIYDDTSYDDIASKILTFNVLTPCSLGHQSQEAVSFQFRPIMGSVVGVLLDKVNGFVYYRIIPDAGDGAKDIRRWLKNKQVNAVSIWGFPTIMTIGGKTHVVNYDLRSVDFVPPFTEGQKNDGVSIGEMNTSFEAKRDLINAALTNKYGDEIYIWTEETFPDYIIARNREDYYKIPYSETNSVITLGDAVKVRRVVTYEIIEEVSMEDIKTVPNDALLAEVNRRAKDGLISAKTVAGEMGIPVEDAEKMKTLTADSQELAVIKAAAGEMKPLEAIATAKQKIADDKKTAEEKAHGEMIVSLKKEKGLLDKDGKATGEMNTLVDKWGKFAVGMTKEAAQGEMDRIINDEEMKKLVASAVTKTPAGEMHGDSTNTGKYSM